MSGGVLSRKVSVSTPNGPIDVIDRSPFGKFDEIQATYPTTASELYTYKLSTVSIGTVTVTYTSSSKKVLTSVVYNVI
jgi:hypothetical protein